VPSLAALEKRVHVTDAADLPPQALVAYDVPDDIAVRNIEISALPKDWARRETHTQQVGNEWLDDGEEAILIMPSVVMPVAEAVDRNALINHLRSDTTRITIAHVIPFTLDPRLFRP
jgi:RES domain-containing protein